MTRSERRAEAQAILDAIEYAPESGPYAPDLVGLWTAGGWFVCAPCSGRIIARGCSHVLVKPEMVWKDSKQGRGVCLCCELMLEPKP